jgi:hypothetical protein
MYPSINIEDGINTLKKALIKHQKEKRFNFNMTNEEIDFIIDLADWVLKNNYFEFGFNNFFHQIKGTAMGTPFAVTFACIYLSMIEIEVDAVLIDLYNFKPIFYKRYIDDIFAIFNNTNEAKTFMHVFNKAKHNQIKLKLTFIGDKVEFLDIEIFKGQRFYKTNLLDSKIFQKQQCKYLYLPPSSFHCNSVFTSFVQSELRRYRLICSNDDDYFIIKDHFKQRLLNRGYSETFLTTIFCVDFDRKKLLFTRNGNNNNTNIQQKNPLVFQTIFTPRHININLNKCLEFIEQLWCDQKTTRVLNNKSKRPILCFKRSKNLSEYLTRARYSYKIDSN